MKPQEAGKMAARLLVAVALVALLLWNLDLQQLLARLLNLSWQGTAAAFAVVLLAIAISAWKWGLILRARQHPLPFVTLVRLYFIGLFFNNVLPSAVGGDAVRAWETSRETREVPEAIGSVVSERLIAGVALGITALLGLPFIEADGRTALLVAVFLVIDVALVALFLIPRVAEGIVGKTLPSRLGTLKAVVSQTVRVVRETMREPRLFFTVLVASVVFQVCVAGVNAAIFHAMGVDVSLAHCVIYTPMIFTLAMLPVSISGFGVREGAYWYFFAQVGVGQAEAVAASLLFFVIVGLCSLPGAPLFVFRRRQQLAPA